MNSEKFTLLELLVVTSIIILLASIFIPMLGKSRERAAKATCISNLKQLGISTILYANESGSYPQAYASKSGGIQYWCGFKTLAEGLDFSKSPLEAYIKKADILQCPSFALANPQDNYKGTFCAFGINAEYIGGDPEALPAPGDTDLDIPVGSPAKTLHIKNPEKTMLYMDSAKAENDKAVESYYFWARYLFRDGSETHRIARSHFRHDRHANGVFADAHVEDKLLPDAIQSEKLKIGWPEREKCER